MLCCNLPPRPEAQLSSNARYCLWGPTPTLDNNIPKTSVLTPFNLHPKQPKSKKIDGPDSKNAHHSPEFWHKTEKVPKNYQESCISVVRKNMPMRFSQQWGPVRKFWATFRVFFLFRSGFEGVLKTYELIHRLVCADCWPVSVSVCMVIIILFFSVQAYKLSAYARK